jgi:hypothetical protein
MLIFPDNGIHSLGAEIVPAGGFSGVVACSLDDAATCAASLPYFLAQAAANSPMTAADYTHAYAQIATFVSSSATSTS